MTKAEQMKIAAKAKAKLAQLDALPKEERCSDTCRGWDVFTQDDGLEIQTCDECCNHCWPEGDQGVRNPDRLTDDEAACLPEAIEALIKEAVDNAEKYNRENPEFARPLNLAEDLSRWQRSLGIPDLPGLTDEEREELEEELAEAKARMEVQ